MIILVTYICLVNPESLRQERFNVEYSLKNDYIDKYRLSSFSHALSM